jgi:hypothetical protein
LGRTVGELSIRDSSLTLFENVGSTLLYICSSLIAMQHMLVKTMEQRLVTVFGRFLRVLYHSIDRRYLIYSANVSVALLTMSALLT